jgi:adenylylsulfate kinase
LITRFGCFISPTNEIRQIAKDIIGENDFIEIYINASLKICEDRDVKGLYKKARNGEIKNFTGISATYEEPKQPNLVINTTLLSIEESVKKIYDYILPLIKNK